MIVGRKKKAAPPPPPLNNVAKTDSITNIDNASPLVVASHPINDKKEGKSNHNTQSNYRSSVKTLRNNTPEIKTNSPKRFAIKPEDLIRHKLKLNKVTPRKSPIIQAKIIAIKEKSANSNVSEKIAKNNPQVMLRPSEDDLVNFNQMTYINENVARFPENVSPKKSPILTRQSSPQPIRIQRVSNDTGNNSESRLKCLIHNVYEDIDSEPLITPQILMQMRKKLCHVESIPRANVIYTSPQRDNEYSIKKARAKLLDPPKSSKKKQANNLLKQPLDNSNANITIGDDKMKFSSKVYPIKSLSPEPFVSKQRCSPSAFFSKLSPITRSKSEEPPRNLSLLQHIYEKDNVSIKSDDTIIQIEINPFKDVDECESKQIVSPRIQFLKDMLEISVDKIKSLSPMRKKSNYSPDPDVKRKLTTTRNFPNRKFTKHQNIHWESTTTESYVTKFKNSLLETKPKLTNFDIKLFKNDNQQRQQKKETSSKFIQNLDEIIDSRKGEFV